MHDLNSYNTFGQIVLEQRILMLANKERCHFLVGLFASFQTEHHVCFAMDYAEGGDLVCQLDEDGISVERTQFYAACIVLGLQFLHEHNIAHRDLKPENILLDSDGYAKIADYGLSREGMTYDTLAYSECGSLYYMAPEIFREGYYTRSVDWWSLGVIIYEMLIGNVSIYSKK
ncbi:serine/threonine-protein kinase N2-like [Xenopus tropicalis]|nr:serine/threonine-protein kinase N2-like [Xenopus tropicalis]